MKRNPDRARLAATAACTLVLLMTAAVALGQDQPPRNPPEPQQQGQAPQNQPAQPNQPAPSPPGAPPAGQQPAAGLASGQQPPADRQPVTAKVIEVTGDVQHSPLEPRSWQKCKVDDEYPEQTIIRTGVRSSIKLQVGSEAPYTAMIIESVGLTVISEAWKTNAVKRVRVGVGYGQVRAGVAEGGLESDFTVDSPVATLSKRGTWDFALFYEPATDRFEISLLDYGLVEALNKITREQRTVLPGQAVTQAMRLWLDESQIRRNVPITDLFGQGDILIAFNRIQSDGLGVLNPGSGGRNLLNLGDRSSQLEFARMLENASRAAAGAIDFNLPPGGPPTITRPEGFFGSGRGDDLIRVIVDPENALARRGHAKPGTYNFRRSAAEAWLNQHRTRH